MSLVKRATCFSKVVTFTTFRRCACGYVEVDKSGNVNSVKCPKCGNIMQISSACCDDCKCSKENSENIEKLE